MITQEKRIMEDKNQLMLQPSHYSFAYIEIEEDVPIFFQGR